MLLCAGCITLYVITGAIIKKNMPKYLILQKKYLPCHVNSSEGKKFNYLRMSRYISEGRHILGG